MQVDRCGAEVGMAELALDDVERDALAGELQRVRVAQLMRREPAPNACLDGEPAQSASRPSMGKAPAARPEQA